MPLARLLVAMFERRRRRQMARVLYDAIVAQARTPVFYGEYEVSDTAEGRLEMIMLHMSLILDRLGKEGSAGRDMGQPLVEAFVTDVDDSLREMGVSDLGVPRRVRKAAAALSERMQAYSGALHDLVNGPGNLAATLCQNIYGGAQQGLGADRLATYMRDNAVELGRQRATDILTGQVRFCGPSLRESKKEGG